MNNPEKVIRQKITTIVYEGTLKLPIIIGESILLSNEPLENLWGKDSIDCKRVRITIEVIE